MIRQLLRYEVEPGEAVEAYLLRPADAKGRLPGVAVFHSTVEHSIRQPAGLAGPAEVHFGLKLAERGMVAICPRNFLWTETNKIDTSTAMKRFAERHPKSKGMARMLLDAQVAVDLLVARSDVDPARIGAIGHSLGAKEVLYLAAFDDRVRATVSSEGGIGTKFSNWDASWYLGEAINDKKFGHEHHELLALVAPRAFLLVGGDSADGASQLAVHRSRAAGLSALRRPPATGPVQSRPRPQRPAESRGSQPRMARDVSAIALPATGFRRIWTGGQDFPPLTWG